ncbi:S41 family peptidase [Haematospirillum jordaniae]|uniref:Peptidase S41 n=1 Tax=Haematospirillum jordaniae TaxID=1549855 RepID=A0A143DCY7_9PROT|nr:S41 family peptidase [Haematospirillum jordaniae]AMW34400.1 peptidase S41 [Haematospirillum jordaniae]NKD44625.1 S41 family peptidase [Haematospirillum jordaniae]NKD57645.1 S41 family peptidase [Haematospirillum jordaniae]NKD59215.1 S41 family peptidase [Haematospirillum jordaniae]NKD67353.1 S41 family peptidase [Haematospirillum jordaniae]
MMRKSLIAALAVLVLSLPVGVTLVFPSLQAQAKADASTYRLLDLFGTVFERVRRDYVEDVTDQQLVESAINGMLTSLDPHSSYLNAESFRDMQTQTRGEFGGLGIEVSMENGLVKVVSPIDDTPAFRAGLKPGDYIIRLDDKQVLGMTLQDAVEHMRGKAGSEIVLTIRREGRDPFEVKLVRDVIKIRSARAKAEGDIGYIRLTAFNEKTFDAMRDGIEKLNKDIGPNKIRGFVLDLRNNPGGLFDQAIAVSDAFLDSGEIVSTRSRRSDDTQRYNAQKGDLTGGLPMVVLINDGSASSSEIVAGALQDHHRAIVVGTRSFGKGSVQTVIPLAGHGAMRLTTARYFTPSGRSIQAVGIEPDIEVNASSQPVRSRSEADLPNALSNPDEKINRSKRSTSQPDLAGEKAGQAAPHVGVAQGKPEEDLQLARALDILRGVSLERQKQTQLQ